MADLDKLADQLSQLTLREVIQLARTIIDRAAPPRPDANARTFSVLLQSAGSGKIQVIKVIRELTGVGLAEAKTLVDNAPRLVRAGLTRDEAETFARKLIEVGATAQVGG